MLTAEICLSERSLKVAGEPMKSHIRVLSVDDHPLVREGIAAIVNNQPDMEVIAQASNGREAMECVRKHQPDIVLMDLRLPDMSGIDALVALRTRFPDARVIMLTTFDHDNEIQRALSAGARSYLLKSMPPKDIADTIRHVHAGKKHIPAVVAEHLAEHLGDETLTDRELQVLRLVMGGNRNREIADRLFISEETVKAHVKHSMEKLGAMDRTQAVTIALRRGLIQL
jgi:DNA-binding NarL/FixJ family response regulator